jgi:hypothetical protein
MLVLLRFFQGYLDQNYTHFPYIEYTHYSDIRDMGIGGKEGLGILDIVV